MGEIADLQRVDSTVANVANATACRSCGSRDLQLVIDLGVQPLANSFIPREQATRPEAHYPLMVFRCTRCSLMEVLDVAVATEIFSDYLYLSSYSSTWLDHARLYVERMTDRFVLGPQSRVVEVASNDGYLLQYAITKGMQVLGIEPAANVARIAEERGVPTRVAFFGSETAARLRSQGWLADLMVANNVLAHVPDINDFVQGFSILLKPEGVVTFEFPHLMNLILETQFDTIYHEHFSYISLLAAMPLFARHGLRIFDVEQLPTHGGSLRVYVCHAGSPYPTLPSVEDLLAEERRAGLAESAIYHEFAAAAHRIKNELLRFLLDCAERNQKLCAYGAAAKGNTLLNFCGVRSDLISFVADRNSYKQGCLLPGTRIPIRAPEELVQAQPDYVLILPWNLRDEIADSLAELRQQGCRFVTAIPQLRIF